VFEDSQYTATPPTERPPRRGRRRSRARFAIFALLAGLAAPASWTAQASAAPLITSFSAGVLNDENVANPQTSDFYTQAGGHPDVAYTKFALNAAAREAEFVRVDLPAGLTVNPQAVPRCSAAAPSGCPSNTRVGTTNVTIANIPLVGKQTVTGAVYNMTPPGGAPSDFAFEVTVAALFTVRTDLIGGVRYYPSGGLPADYGNYFTISNISNLLGTQLEKSELIFWGAPEEHNGGGAADNAFLTNPSTCSGPQTTRIFASTYAPVTTGTASYTTPVGATGCEQEPFAPTISVTPNTTQREQPDGVAIDLHVPQDPKPSGIASSHLREASVALPVGMSLDPSAANGLQACTDAQFRAATNEALACPAASQVGTVEISTPVLGSALTGGLFVGQPLSSDPSSGQEYRLFLDAENAAAGVKVRLVGAVRADPVNGRLTSTFSEQPQVPFTDLKLSFKTGAGALLANPPGCGAATTSTTLIPWSGQSSATPAGAFTVDSDGAGGACPSPLPFAPTALATPSSTTAGASTHLAFDISRADGEQALGSLSTTLPAGMLADLTGVTLCAEPAAAQGSCPAASQIGTVAVTAGTGPSPLGLTGTVSLTGPYEGRPFGLSIAVPAVAGPYELGTVVVRAAVAVDTVGGRVTITAAALPTIVGGVPLRLRTIHLVIDRAGFLLNPTDCTTTAITGSLGSTSAAVAPYSSAVQMTACSSLGFSPTLTFTPTTTERDAATGLAVDLKLPSGSSDLASAVVQLPPGLTLNPAVATGLQACTDLQLAIGTVSAVACPMASRLGTVEIDTPLLPGPMSGSLYLGAPLSLDPASGQEYRLFLDAESAAYGLSVRLAGQITADPASGRLTVTFPSTPPIPFTDLELDLAGGPRAALANPPGCGPVGFASKLDPITGSAATPAGGFTIDRDGSGGACPPSAPFAPTAVASAVPSTAGAASAFTLDVTRPGGQQYLAGLQTVLPPGLVGRIAAFAECPDGAAGSGGCPASSRVGSALVGVGAGPSPLQLPGTVYLTGPYEGAPFGLSVAIPAEAVGPFDFGTVVVRARILIDERTARVSVVSDPLPTIVGGAPLRLQTLAITTSPAFTVNPTSCVPANVETRLSSTAGTIAVEPAPFTASGCDTLAFAPSMSATTSAQASRAAGAPLQIDLAYPSGGGANLASVAATVPSQLPVRQGTLKQACPEATFAAAPAACPPGARVGSATVLTPLLAQPLSGPAYLVSHAGAAFPDLDLIVEGDGLRLALRGRSDVRSGVITTTFAELPDVPLSRFTLTLPMGPYSALGAGGALCGEALSMSTVLVGQNGARLARQVPVAVSGCAGAASGSGARLARLRIAPARFAAASRGASIGKPPSRRRTGRRSPSPPGGTTISYLDAGAGAATLTVLRPGPGERRGGRCVARAGHRRRPGRACTMLRPLGSFTHADGAGANRFWFTGRLRGRKLGRGAYRLEVTARYAGGRRSAPLLGSFSVRG
jgi:hypothetical protein